MKAKAIKWLSEKVNDDTTKAELDIINYIKSCINAQKEEKLPKVDWIPMFETLWKMYPRKVGKQNAIKQFEHKVRGLNEDECKAKCNLIYKAEMRYIKQLQENKTSLEYTKHFSSWLNSEVPNSKYYKGR